MNLGQRSAVTGKLFVSTPKISSEPERASRGNGFLENPSDTVTVETTYGASSAAGSSTDYSRGDHTHGTPTLPDHNDTGSKQGGTTNEYYHLTNAQHGVLHALNAGGNFLLMQVFS